MHTHGESFCAMWNLRTLGLGRCSDLVHILISDLQSSISILPTANIFQWEEIGKDSVPEHLYIPMLTWGLSRVSLFWTSCSCPYRLASTRTSPVVHSCVKCITDILNDCIGLTNADSRHDVRMSWLTSFPAPTWSLSCTQKPARQSLVSTSGVCFGSFCGSIVPWRNEHERSVCSCRGWYRSSICGNLMVSCYQSVPYATFSVIHVVYHTTVSLRSCLNTPFPFILTFFLSAHSYQPPTHGFALFTCSIAPDKSMNIHMSPPSSQRACQHVKPLSHSRPNSKSFISISVVC